MAVRNAESLRLRHGLPAKRIRATALDAKLRVNAIGEQLAQWLRSIW